MYITYTIKRESIIILRLIEPFRQFVLISVSKIPMNSPKLCNNKPELFSDLIE